MSIYSKCESDVLCAFGRTWERKMLTGAWGPTYGAKPFSKNKPHKISNRPSMPCSVFAKTDQRHIFTFSSHLYSEALYIDNRCKPDEKNRKVKTKSSVLQIVAVNIVHRPLLRVYGFHTGECSASQTTHTAPGWCPQRGRGVEDRIVDESQHSSRHQLSMFGKVHLQFRDAMIGSHTPTRLKGREEENSR